MEKTVHILIVIIFVSAFLLSATYFLPVEGSWSPSDAWHGYYEASGNYIAGFNVGLIEVFPFAVGIFILLTLALLRWPKICISKLTIFSTVWILSLALEVNYIFWNPSSYKLSKLWIILFALFVPFFVFILVLALRKSLNQIAVLTFAVILAFSSILYQLVSITWYLIEDGLLLNIGSVTGVTSATTLFVALLIQRHIFKEIRVRDNNISQSESMDLAGTQPQIHLPT